MPPLNTFTRSCLAIAIAQGVVGNAQSATIEVGITSDDNNAGCTLRQAVLSLNSAALQGGCINTGAGFGIQDTVNLSLDDGAQITLLPSSGGAINISSGKAVTINGPQNNNITLNGNGVTRLFSVNGGELNLNSLTLASGGGTAVGRGGGIYGSSCTLTANNVTFSGNSTVQGGAAISSASCDVIIQDSTFEDNVGTSGSSGGGAIFSSNGSLSISNSTLQRNRADVGGSISASSSQLNITESSLSQNTATNAGGALYASASPMLIERSAIINNIVTDQSMGSSATGGGIKIVGDETSTEINNSTISGNSAVQGAGISASDNCSLTMRNSTITGNSVKLTSGTTEYRGGGILSYDSCDVSLYNNIIAGNVSLVSGSEISNGKPPFETGSNFVSSYNNLIGSAEISGNQAVFDFVPFSADIMATSSIATGSSATLVPTYIESILSPIANNGGPSPTHALVEGSPAIDQAAAGQCGVLDQRRVERDVACDIGSYEFVPAINDFFVIPLENRKAVIVPL